MQLNREQANQDLLNAASVGNLANVKEALERHANIEARTTDGNNRTAVHMAAENGHTEVLAFLLSKGANVEAGFQSKDQWTPLHSAVVNSHLPAVSVLLSYGANIEHLQGALSPLWTALVHIPYFIYPQAHTNPTQRAICTQKICKTIELLLEWGANPQALHEGKTLLWWAKHNQAHPAHLNRYDGEVVAQTIQTFHKKIHSKKMLDLFYEAVKQHERQPTALSIQLDKNSANTEQWSSSTHQLQLLKIQSWFALAEDFGGLRTTIRQAASEVLMDMRDMAQTNQGHVNPMQIDIAIISKICSQFNSPSLQFHSDSIIRFAKHAQHTMADYAQQMVQLTQALPDQNVVKEKIVSFSTNLKGASLPLGNLTAINLTSQIPNVIGRVDEVVKSLNHLKSLKPEELINVSRSLLADAAEFSLRQFDTGVGKLESLMRDASSAISLDGLRLEFSKMLAIPQNNRQNISLTTISNGLEICNQVIGMINPNAAKSMAILSTATLNIAQHVANFSKIAAVAGPLAPYVAIGGSILGAFKVLGGLFGSGQDQNQQLLQQISAQIHQLAIQINTRFDRIEQILGSMTAQINQFYYDVMREFRHLNGQLEQLRITVRSIEQRTTFLQATMDDRFKELYEDKFHRFQDGLKRRLVAGKDQISEGGWQSFYEAFIYWTNRQASDNIIAGDIDKFGSEDNICDRVKSAGIDGSINMLLCYANHLVPTLRLTRVANPQAWAEGARQLIAFILNVPNYKFNPERQMSDIDEVIAVGEAIHNAIRALQKCEQLFIRLCQNYRTALEQLLEQIERNADVSENDYKKLDNAYSMLLIYVAMAFGSDYNEDIKLRQCLLTHFWLKRDIEIFCQHPLWKQNKNIVAFGIQQQATKSIEELEKLLMKKVRKATSDPEQACNLLVSEVLDELYVFKTVFSVTVQSRTDKLHIGQHSLFRHLPAANPRRQGYIDSKVVQAYNPSFS